MIEYRLKFWFDPDYVDDDYYWTGWFELEPPEVLYTNNASEVEFREVKDA